MPAAWNTRSTPFIARRTARRSSTSQRTRSQSRSSIARCSSSADGQAEIVAALCQGAGDLRPDETGGPGEQRAGLTR